MSNRKTQPSVQKRLASETPPIEKAKQEAAEILARRGIILTGDQMDRAVELCRITVLQPTTAEDIIEAVDNILKLGAGGGLAGTATTTKQLTAEQKDSRDGTGLLPPTQKWSAGSNK